MHELHVAAAYDRLCGPYTELFGSVENHHARDIKLVTQWRDGTTGALLDAGCGPGHWTQLLAGTGRTTLGLDLSERFLRSAGDRFPNIQLVRASLHELPFSRNSFGGILAWYSLIHVAPEDLQLVLAEFAAALAEDGSLLLGLFDGEAGTPFEHKVAPAYFWSPDAMRELLEATGFTVTHVECRRDAGSRPHVAMTAGRGA